MKKAIVLLIATVALFADCEKKETPKRMYSFDAGYIKYEATTTGAGTVSGAALSLGTVTAGLSGSLPTGQLSLGACLSLGYADLFNMATQSGTSTYPSYFTAGSVYALSSIASRTFSVENSSGEELYHLNDHYHSFTEQNGKIIIGIPHNRTSIDDRSFNIADTQTYRDGVAAVTVASRAVLYCNATNYSDFDSGFDCDMTGSSYHYTTGGFTYGRLEVRNSTGAKIKDIRVKMPESSGQVTATVSITGAQVPAAADNATITATATLSNSGTASNTYGIYMETVTNTTSTVTMQVAHGSGSSKVILAQKSVTPTHPTVSITGTTGMTTSASNYTTYDRSVGLGSSSVYTSGSTQYGRVQISLSNGVTQILRVSMPAASSVTVASITSASTEYDYSDYYYSGGRWKLYVHAKDANGNVLKTDTIDVQHAVNYGAQTGATGHVEVTSTSGNSAFIKLYDSNWNAIKIGSSSVGKWITAGTSETFGG